MKIPKLKRIKVSTDAELRNWLRKNAKPAKEVMPAQQVMIVTCDKTSADKYISSDQVRAAFSDYGWVAGQSYTLIGNLVGHVVSRP